MKSALAANAIRRLAVFVRGLARTGPVSHASVRKRSGLDRCGEGSVAPPGLPISACGHLGLTWAGLSRGQTGADFLFRQPEVRPGGTYLTFGFEVAWALHLPEALTLVWWARSGLDRARSAGSPGRLPERAMKRFVRYWAEPMSFGRYPWVHVDPGGRGRWWRSTMGAI
jgi:hypothetical protein